MSAQILLTVITILGTIVFFWARKNSQEKRKLEKRLYHIDRAFATLTAITSSSAAVEFITEELANIGFTRIIVFTLGQETGNLKGQTAIGFGPDFNPKKLQIPIIVGENIIGKSVFQNEFTVIETFTNKMLSEIGLPADSIASAMVAPIVKKTGVWSINETETPETEMSPVLGAIVAGRGTKTNFSREEKELFQSFAYQTGAVLEKGYIFSQLRQREINLNHKIYEISVLKELNERTGYELNVTKIVDIISGSLTKLLKFSAVAFMLFTEDEQILFKVRLEETVNPGFIEEVKQRMLNSLSVLKNKEIPKELIKEEIVGAIQDENAPMAVKSFFNIPLTINENLAGVITVASYEPGLYKEDEMTVLYKIVTQASSAVSKLQSVLETEKGKLTSMVSSMADGVIMVDHNLVLTIINPAARAMLEIENGNSTSLLDVVEKLEGKINLKLKLDEAVKKDALVVTDGIFFEKSAIQVLISPVKDNGKNLLGVVILLHDITKEIELAKLREEFTAMMIHELRAPLTAVRGSADIILTHDQELDPKEVKDLIEIIKKESEDMLKLVSDLLDIAHLEQGKFKVLKIPTDLNNITKEQIDLFKGKAVEKGLTLKFKPLKNPLEVELDKTRIAQVITNLLLNAIKFTDQGGVVTVVTDRSDNEVKVSVTDTGIGMSQDQVANLFNKFKQLKPVGSEGEPGTGLGLVIAKGIIENHGGHLWVESKDKIGSTFSFSIPIKKVSKNN